MDRLLHSFSGLAPASMALLGSQWRIPQELSAESQNEVNGVALTG